MAGPYGSVGTDYRELQAPAQVDTDLPNNGAAERAAALHSVFQEFEGQSADVYNQIETKRGALAGYASGATGHPQYRTGFNQFTAYSRAFNNAATGAYAVEAEAQADDTAARLRVQANNNPETFRATFSAARDAVLKNAPPLAVPMLTELYNKHLAAGMEAISGDQAAEQRTTQRQAYDLGIQRQTSRVAILQGSANPHDQVEALDEQVKLSLLIDGGVKSGLYSEAEGRAMHVTAMRSITEQVFETQFDNALNGPGGALDAVAMLERFRQAHLDNLADTKSPVILPEPEYQQLYAGAVTKLREYNLGIASLKANTKTAAQLRFEAGDRQYTGMLLGHTLTERDLQIAVQNGDLAPERATALRAQLLANPTSAVTKSNPEAYARIARDPNFLSMPYQEIASAPGLSDSDRIKLINEQQQRNATWEGTQSVKDGIRAIGAQLKIPAGTRTELLSDDQRKAYTEGVQEYLTILQGTDPAKRDSAAATAAQTVVKHMQQREIQGQIDSLMTIRQSTLQSHGPGSPAAWDSAKLQEYLKQKDATIAALKAQLAKDQ